MVGTLIEACDLNDAYAQTIGRVLQYGAASAPRGLATVELTPATITISEPWRNILNCPERKLNYAFSVAEWLWIVLGRDDVQSIAYYNKQIANYSDDGVKFFGAYGPRFFAQIGYAIDTLTRDRDSRQAVVTLWRECPPPTKDYPCTIMFHFLVRNDRLNMITYMRSNDIFLGFPYDIFNFTQIQRYMAYCLNVGVGTYTHNVGSLHAYAPNFHMLEKCRATAANFVSDQPPPFQSGVPFDLYDTFTNLASDAPEPERWIDYPDEWRDYCNVLWYRRHRDVGLLPQPWRRLVEAQNAA